MDDHARRLTVTSSSSPPSPASFVSVAGNGNNLVVLEFPYTEVPEQWLMMDSAGDDNVQQPQQLVEVVEHGAVWPGDGGSLSSASADALSGNPPAAAAAVARRGRGGTTGAGGGGPAVSHVEAERNRRDRLHRLFCDLRAAVPAVSRMDKASLLADAAAYIVELRTRVEQLEAEATRAAASPFVNGGDAAAAEPGEAEEEEEEELEVRMAVGQREAALRLTTAARHRHAPARFMDALRSLDLPVRHACVCRFGGTTVQDAVVDVPAELRDESCLRAALLRRLKKSG